MSEPKQHIPQAGGWLGESLYAKAWGGESQAWGVSDAVSLDSRT